MKERPILFSGPMVRALLAGTKTQTRRVIKPAPPAVVATVYRPFKSEPNNWQGYGDGLIHWYGRCPYGVPGDRLWVRETHIAHERGHVQYAADFTRDPQGEREHGVRWNPSIYMRRWASRITLEIADVRVERLQEITRGDAMAEGCPFPNMADGDDPRHWYTQLWASINGAGSWDANPWVWVIRFKTVGQHVAV